MSCLACDRSQASTLSIEPITPRAKPPPFFFTGKPNLYALYDRLQSALLATERRLAAEGLWPAFAPMPEMGKIGWKWKNQEEMLEIANVSVCVLPPSWLAEFSILLGELSLMLACLILASMTKTEYDKLLRMLVRLTRLRHYSNVVADTRSVSALTGLLAPFEKVAAGSGSKLARSLEIGGQDGDDGRGGAGAVGKGPPANKTLDDHGRSYTTGTRKEAKAMAYLIPVAGVARAMNAVNEAREHRAFVAAERAKDEAQFEQRRQAQASGAEQMQPTWREADAKRGREIADENKQRKKLGLELLPVPAGFEVSPLGQLLRPAAAQRSPTPANSSAASTSASSPSSSTAGEKGGESSSRLHVAGQPDGREIIPLAFSGPLAPEPSASNSNAPSSSTERDGTLHFPNGTVPSPNADPLLGSILINNVPLHRFFVSPKDREAVLRPFIVSRTTGAFNVFATVKNGGTTGQAEALALAIGRGIAVHQPMAKLALAKCQSGALGVVRPLKRLMLTLFSLPDVVVTRGSPGRHAPGRAEKDGPAKGPQGQYLGQTLKPIHGTQPKSETRTERAGAGAARKYLRAGGRGRKIRKVSRISTEAQRSSARPPANTHDSRHDGPFQAAHRRRLVLALQEGSREERRQCCSSGSARPRRRGPLPQVGPGRARRERLRG